MDLADKVAAFLPHTDYSARECMDSRRKTLVFQGVEYCMLSRADKFLYCPLQAEQESGALISRCRRNEYLEELEERGRRLRDGDRER